MRVSELAGSRQLTRTDKKSRSVCCRTSLSASSFLRSFIRTYVRSFVHSFIRSFVPSFPFLTLLYRASLPPRAPLSSIFLFCKENTTLTDGRRATSAWRGLAATYTIKATNSVGALSSKRNREFKCHRSVMRSFLASVISPRSCLFLHPALIFVLALILLLPA